jgi:hypothetical protein
MKSYRAPFVPSVLVILPFPHSALGIEPEDQFFGSGGITWQIRYIILTEMFVLTCQMGYNQQ